MKDRKSGHLVTYNHVTVMFDLDGTLLYLTIKDPEKEVVQKALSNGIQHLQQAKITLYGYNCYLIFPVETKKIFEFLLALPGVRIGFITAAEYTAEYILPFLEHALELPSGCLQTCMFINAHDMGDVKTSKGEKLSIMRNNGVFRSGEHVILVDDNLLQLESAVTLGFTDNVHARGFYIMTHEIANEDGTIHKKVQIDVNDDYFQEIRQKVTAELAQVTIPACITSKAVLKPG